MVDTSKLRGRKKRKARQRNVKEFMELREDLQLDGRLPTTPEGAIRDERVDPAQQTEQQLPAVVAEAARNGWATPDHIKPKIVDALIEPFVKRDVVYAPDGTAYEVPPDRHLLTKNAQVLATLDKMQHERDHPEGAGDININNQVNVVAWDQMSKPPQHVQAGEPDQVERRIQEVQKDGAKNKRTDGDGDVQGSAPGGKDGAENGAAKG